MRNWIIAVVSAIVIIGVLLYVNLWRPKVEPGPADGGPELTTEAEPSPATEAAITAIPPSFDVVRVGSEGTGVIAGRAEPNAEVTVKAGDRVIGAAVANRNGEWVLIFDDPLEPGTQELSLSAVVPGGEPIVSANVVIVAIPEASGVLAGEAETEGVVAVLAPRFGGGPSRILQKPGMVLEETLDRRLLVETIDYDAEGVVVISGKSGPAAEIRLYIDNAYLGSVTGDEAGRWSFIADDPIAAGPHVLRLDQIFEGDDVEIRIEQPFDRESPLDLSLAEGRVIIRRGNNLWKIARRIYGAGVQYTVIYRANREQIRDPDLIYPGQQFSLPRAQNP